MYIFGPSLTRKTFIDSALIQVDRVPSSHEADPIGANIEHDQYP